MKVLTMSNICLLLLCLNRCLQESFGPAYNSPHELLTTPRQLRPQASIPKLGWDFTNTAPCPASRQIKGLLAEFKTVLTTMEMAMFSVINYSLNQNICRQWLHHLLHLKRECPFLFSIV
jgi:hypothetical protein